MSNTDKISSFMGWADISLSTRYLMITEQLSHIAIILFALLYFQTTISIPCYWSYLYSEGKVIIQKIKKKITPYRNSQQFGPDITKQTVLLWQVECSDLNFLNYSRSYVVYTRVSAKNWHIHVGLLLCTLFLCVWQDCIIGKYTHSITYYIPKLTVVTHLQTHGGKSCVETIHSSP